MVKNIRIANGKLLHIVIKSASVIGAVSFLLLYLTVNEAYERMIHRQGEQSVHRFFSLLSEEKMLLPVLLMCILGITVITVILIKTDSRKQILINSLIYALITLDAVMIFFGIFVMHIGILGICFDALMTGVSPSAHLRDSYPMLIIISVISGLLVVLSIYRKKHGLFYGREANTDSGTGDGFHVPK